MKITAIQAKNFIGAQDVDVRLTKPVCLFAGPNFSGKSSIQEAVRMALTGESVRVSLKKEYRQLITGGADVGYAVVEHDGDRSAITLPNGAHEQTGKNRPPAVLPYVLDAQRFSSLPDNERRTFLFGLMGLRTDGQGVIPRMVQAGLDSGKIDEIAPHLRAGFEAAHKEAQTKAREAKAAWRAITGETYGSLKAVTWVASKPEVDHNKLTELRIEKADLDKQLEQQLSDLGDMQARAKQAADQAARAAGLRQTASTYARIADKLRVDEAGLAEWEVKVKAEKDKEHPPIPFVAQTFTCPACSASLQHRLADGALIIAEKVPVVEAREPSKLREYERALDLMRKSVDNDRRDLAEADAAAKRLAEIDDEALAAPNSGVIDTARARITEGKSLRDAKDREIRAIEDLERQASAADKKTAAAGEHHFDVAQWEEIAEALSPSGIPGQILSEALGPINDRLALSANLSGWKRINIGADMSIYAAEEGEAPRSYRLLSESEKWRADAMIAESVSFLSGVRLLVLDRVDVLDMAGREDLICWLDDLAVDGAIDTALLFATLKALPANLPQNVEAFWLRDGTINMQKEAA
jgi:hypothetical protein